MKAKYIDPVALGPRVASLDDTSLEVLDDKLKRKLPEVVPASN
jgi:hypothetical protein